jgi:hypothetical protein
MVSLSHGPAENDLVAGSIVILLLHRLWTAAPELKWLATQTRTDAVRWLRGVAVLIALYLLVSMAYHSRLTYPYRDLPADQQTSDPGQISAAYGWLEVGQPTMAYLQQVDDCVKKYPANRLSVLPDTPTQHVVYDRAAALPVTLGQPTEYRGSETQILDAARKLDAEGDYLVLFQSTWDGLGFYKGLPNPTSLGTPVWDYGDPDFYNALQLDLTGQRYVCGSLIAVYKPPAG